MRHLKVLLLLVALGIACYAGAQIYPQWAVQCGGYDYDYPGDSVTDPFGNTYVTGNFKAGASFGTDNTVTSAGGSDIFVAKLSPDGEWLWAVSAGGASSDQGSAIALDTAGNIYVGGSFSQTVTFGNTTLSVTGGSNSDLFVAKLSADGDWLWAVSAGGTGYDACHTLALDSSGNILMAGVFTFLAHFGTFIVSGAGAVDIAVAKLSADGEWQWARQAGSTASDSVSDIVVDAMEHVYIVGSFYSNYMVTFGPLYLPGGAGASDIYVAALDQDGSWLWVVSGGGTGTDHGRGIAIHGNMLYIAGLADGSFNFGSHTLSGFGGADACVASLSLSGVWLWAARCGGTGYDAGTAIATDTEGRVIISGYYGSDVIHCGDVDLNNAGMTDVFVARLGSTGTWLDAARGGGIDNEDCYVVDTDSAGNMYLTGYFYQACAFGNTTLSCTGGSDIFVAKISGSMISDDMAALELTGSLAPNLNLPNSYYVLVQNRGIATQDNYQVKLIQDINTVLAAVAGPALMPGETANVELVWNPSTAGFYTLHGNVDLDGDLYTPNDSTEPLDVTVQQPGTLAGYVRALNNTPLAGAIVTCTGALVTQSVTTGTSGTYSIYLPAGLYSVTATHTGYDPYTHPTVALSSDMTTTLHFWLPTAAGDDPSAPDASSMLISCYPNPFRHHTEVSFSLEETRNIHLGVFDLRGRQVAILWDGTRAAGHTKILWDGKDADGNPLPNGIYLICLQAGSSVQTRRISLIR